MLFSIQYAAAVIRHWTPGILDFLHIFLVHDVFSIYLSCCSQAGLGSSFESALACYEIHQINLKVRVNLI